MPYATHETHFIGSEHYSVDMDLCDLLQTMKLDSSKKTAEHVQVASLPQSIQDDLMAEDLNYQSDAASETSSSSSNTSQLSYGCAYLQAIHSQMQDYPTTGGEYLDAIFTHREILFSYPAAHQECARAFTDLAYMLEKRAWRADREADTEAVTAFRHEAWVIASSL
ncbi:hypothetical protein BDZ97DRAFT_1903191 [Flammula alnicola]|nr:hypothetical protein BDZ97DRAFT_1903191 [Flammula alnicola]